MKNFPINHEGKTYWISRSIAAVGFIFCLDDNKLFVLANQRGKGAPDFQGYWNCPCGYLDYNETVAECCAREIAEETNLYVNPKHLKLFGINDDPGDEPNKQNVTFRYYTFDKNMYKSQTIYAKGAEKDEVASVNWIQIGDLNNYNWAFNHNVLIAKIALKCLYEFLTLGETLLLKKICSIV